MSKKNSANTAEAAALGPSATLIEERKYGPIPAYGRAEKIGQINDVRFYADGHIESDNMGGTVWFFLELLSRDYNRLKAKLYNVVEASVQDQGQVNALKGLIRGFCDDSYRESCNSVEVCLSEMGLREVINPSSQIVGGHNRRALPDEATGGSI